MAKRKSAKSKRHDARTIEATFAAELLHVKDQDVAPSAICLDPNNPRFVTEDGKRCADAEIPDDHVQKQIFDRVRDLGIDDVRDKIASLGFQRHERIFIRPLKNDRHRRYVVLEGNRRVASVKTLLRQNEIGEIKLAKEVLASLKDLPAVVYEGHNPDIAWLVQGLRHISAISRWDPIQQARFIEMTAKQSGQEEIEIGKQFGLSAKQTTDLVDSLHLFRDAKKNREYGDLIDDSKFAMFHEGVFNKRPTLAIDFLGFDEKTKHPKKESNFSRFLGLITSPDKKTPAKIRRAIDVRDDLSKLVPESDLLEKVLDGDIELDAAVAEAINRRRESESEEFDADVELGRLKKIIESLKKLPVPGIALSPEKRQFLKPLREVRKLIDEIEKLLAK